MSDLGGEQRKSGTIKAKLRSCQYGLPCSSILQLTGPRPALAGIVGVGDETDSQERLLMSKVKARDLQKSEVRGWERKVYLKGQQKVAGAP